MFPLSPSLLPADWNVEVKAGTWAAMLGHEVNLKMSPGC